MYGRLRNLARDLKVDVPGVQSVVELAAEGNSEALGRLVELARAAKDDEAQKTELSESFTEVARTAPEELIVALRGAPAPDRDAAETLLAKGMVKAADAQHPLWPAINKLKGAVDPELATFAKGLDTRLSQRIAQEKAPSSGGALAQTPTGPAVSMPAPQAVPVKGTFKTADTRPRK